MNLKVVNLVAIQFGIFVGIMSWLAYSQLPFARSRVTESPRSHPATERVANVAPNSNDVDQESETADRAEDEETNAITEPPAPVLPHEYSPAAVQQYAALAAQRSYQQIAPRRYASAGAGPAYVTTSAPSSAAAAPEPAAISSDYVEPLEPAAYVEPAPVVLYSQPQWVVFNNERSFRRRCRPTLSANAFPQRNHRRQDRLECRQNGSTESRPTRPGIAHHRNVDSLDAPTKGFAGRGRR